MLASNCAQECRVLGWGGVMWGNSKATMEGEIHIKRVGEQRERVILGYREGLRGSVDERGKM